MSSHDFLSPITPLSPPTPFKIQSSAFDLAANKDVSGTRKRTQQYQPTTTPKVQIVNGHLAPPQSLPLSKSPEIYSSSLAPDRRLRSPREILGVPELRWEIPYQGSSIAARRQFSCKRLRELQAIYAQPHEAPKIPKPLSPRVVGLLHSVGMIRYHSLFQMEEIDYDVFCSLSERDLVQLGVTDVEDRYEICKAVMLAPGLMGGDYING